jgi:IS5 family transposase
MTTTIADEIEHLGNLLQGATEHSVVYKPYGDSLPYRWELTSRKEPVHHIATIQLTATDVVSLHGRSDRDSAAYLHERFGPLLVSGLHRKAVPNAAMHW